ncbi:MAG TPA: sigma-70 family RNA polymerase sigma factor [Acidimicrobiales bacterium]|nr:sigma-70 family RNA polymerase sigma factor [Acidimicrobiales bacterium]
MDKTAWLSERFEDHRGHLFGVAYRMLGSLTEADDAVQDAWLRVSRSSPEVDQVKNLRGWLTTIVARVCLNMLRARKARREQPLVDFHVPDPVVTFQSGGIQPEEEALLADSVGLALLVVLDTLTPAERLAFVLHDLFGLPFEEIAPMVERAPTAARQLASRARRRVRGAAPETPETDLGLQRTLVDAFFAAARDGHFDALVGMLDPDVVLRVDGGAGLPAASLFVRGSDAVSRQAGRGLRSLFVSPGMRLRPALVNGAAGVVVTADGRPVTVIGFTIAAGKIVEIDAVSDPMRLPTIAAALLANG